MYNFIAKKKHCSTLSILLVILLIMMHVVSPAQAATTCDGSVSNIYLGNRRAVFFEGTYEWSVLAYVYYDYNTTTELSLHSMVQTVANEGFVPVNGFSFSVSDIRGAVVDSYSYNDQPANAASPIFLNAGESARIEVAWHPVASGIYTKGGNNECILTKIMTSCSEGMHQSLWAVEWLPNTKNISFHY